MSDDEVQLVPVAGSWVPPGRWVVRFGGEERVTYAEDEIGGSL